MEEMKNDYRITVRNRDQVESVSLNGENDIEMHFNEVVWKDVD
jgi:hypothetical protein